jgi:recombinational DNA repair ATPase RecF
MFLKNITINHFKSIQKATFSFEPGLNILIGKNGAGKSNLLQFILENTFYDAIISIDSDGFDYQFTISYEQETLNNDIIFTIKKERSIEDNEIKFSKEIQIHKIKNLRSRNLVFIRTSYML